MKTLHEEFGLKISVNEGEIVNGTARRGLIIEYTEGNMVHCLYLTKSQKDKLFKGLIEEYHGMKTD